MVSDSTEDNPKGSSKGSPDTVVLAIVAIFGIIGLVAFLAFMASHNKPDTSGGVLIKDIAGGTLIAKIPVLSSSDLQGLGFTKA